MTTMLETLNETIDAYTHGSRGLDVARECQYYANGRTCAVGRCMLRPQDFQEAGDANDLVKDHCDGKTLDELLKPDYHGFPLTFWVVLQSLHDSCKNWNETGLTNTGRKNAQLIRETHCLGEIDVQPAGTPS